MSDTTIVLLGDSILDNGAYTEPEPDTTTILSGFLGSTWSVERLAQDGATMNDVQLQMNALKARPDVAVLSVGGNDAVEHIGLLNRQNTSAADLLEELLAVAENFGRRYHKVAQSVAVRASRLILCTIYDVPLEPSPYDQLARVPIALLNDQIVRAGVHVGADVLELRSVCTERTDFVLQIEPSAQGAGKIARAIAALVQESPKLHRGRVFAA